MTAVTDPPLPYELLDTTYGEYPRALRDSDNGLDCAVEGAAEPVRTCIDTIQADPTLRINAYQQRQVSGDDTRECIRRGDHKHNDHLQPCGPLHVCAIQNRPHHHAWNCDEAHYTDKGKVMTGPEDERKRMSGARAYAPHLVDSRRQCTAKRFRYERTICLRERCTRKHLCRIADFTVATSHQ
jgi:hypothetical protein